MTYKRELRDEMVDWINSQEWHYHVTLAFNMKDDLRETFMRERLKAFDLKLSRKLLGPRWHKFFDRRPQGLVFVEKSKGNPHYHALIQLPEPEWQADQMENLISEAWRQTVTSGTARTVPYDRSTLMRSGVAVHAWYPVKELDRYDHLSRFKCLDELRTKSRAI